MLKFLCKLLIVSVLASGLFISCRKTDSPPQTCLLSSLTNQKGNVLQAYTYDSNNRLIKDVSDSSHLTMDFSYNALNLPDKINMTIKATSGSFVYAVALTYDATGLLQKSVATINGIAYQSSTFTYTNNQVTKITSTDRQGNLITTRLEYVGENISKLYQKYDTDPEFLYYECTKFDDKTNLRPAAYKYFALGLIDIVDDFSYMNKNNALSEKFYDEKGKAFYTTESTFEYNTTLQPTKVTLSINDEGHKSSVVNLCVYTCK